MIKMLQIASLALLLASFNVSALDDFRISDIRIEGTQRISDGTVLSYLPMAVGDMTSRRKVSDAIKALYGTGFFGDIEFLRENNILVIRLKERPAISDINISGNKDIKTEDLTGALDQIGLSEGEVFQRVQLTRVEGELIRQYYSRGKYNVKINTSVRDLPRNRVEVNINVSEGKPAKIKHINIVGNTAFDDDTLRDEFESDTSNWTSWYSSDDQYSKDKISGDMEKLRSYYQDRGYLDFSIESTQVSISQDRREIYITINIREGDIYTVTGVELAGDMILDPVEMRKLLMISDGEIFSRKRVEQSSKNITAVLSNLGYAFADVVQIPNINKEEKTVAMKLLVNPGKRVVVRRIVFRGNDRTRDEVLRREFRQFEGAWFSQIAVDRSRLRLNRLGYFNEVNIETPQVAGTDDMVDIIVTVEEANAGSFQFGLGYSQVQGIIFSASLNQQNFLGSGKHLGLTVNNSTVYKRFSASYTDPYFTDDGVSLGYILSYRETDQGELNLTNYTTDTGLIGINASVPVTETDRVHVGLAVEQTVVHATKDYTSDYVVNYLCRLEGIPTEPTADVDDCAEDITQVDSTIETIRAELGWARDSRNHFFKPTRGTYQRIGAEASTPGSTIQYYKIDYQNKTYFPLFGDFVVMLGGRIGYGETYGDSADTPFPFFEHFYAGGVRSVRGWEDNTLGPRDERNDPLGGALLTTANLEMVLPLPFLKDKSTTRLSWFVDAGNVFQNKDSFDAEELRFSTGLSLRWNAPVGPIEISYGYPINEKEGDNTESIQFTFGNF